MDIANNFNTYFTSVVETIIDEQKYTGDVNFSKYLSKPMTNSIAVEHTDGN